MNTLSKEVIETANTIYGLACGVFTQNSARAARVAHALEAGTAWVRRIVLPSLQLPVLTSIRSTLQVNCYSWFDLAVPFGGSKQSGKRREFGPEALHE